MKKKKSKKTIVLEWLGIFVEVTPVIITIYYVPDIGNAVLTFLGIHPTNMTLGIVSIALAGLAVVVLAYLFVRGIICLILRIIRSFKRKSKETSDNL